MTEVEFFSFLIDIMFEARKNKRFGRDWAEFERRWAPLLVVMMWEMYEKTYRVDHNYSFLTSVPKWREIFATIAQGRMSDLVVCSPLSPYIEAKLHPRTFNNRKKKGATAAIDQTIEDVCEVTQGYTKPARVIKWDLKGCFPNALCDHIERCYCEVIDENADDLMRRFGPEMPGFLKWLAMVSVHCYPAQHCELRTPKILWEEHIEPSKSLFNAEPGVGMPIGRQISQTGMGLYMNPEVIWLNEECGIRSTLFMDDCLMVVPEEMHEYALGLFPVLRERLAAKGMRLNEKKFYDQPYQHGYEFLGSHIKPYRLHINNPTYGRAMERVTEYNQEREKYACIDQFMSSINSYLGLLKTRTDYRRLEHLVESVATEWWEYFDYDQQRRCINCKPEYSIKSRLNNKYHLHLKK